MSIFKNKLFFSTVFVFLYMNFTNVFSLIYQVILGRNLSLEDYGLISSFHSIFGVLSLPTIVIPIIVSDFVLSNNDKNLLKGEINSLINILSILIISELILIFSFSSDILRILKFTNINYIYFLIILQIISFIIAIYSGLFISNSEYKKYSLISSSPLIFRVLFLLIFLYLINIKLSINLIFLINIIGVLLAIIICNIFCNIKISYHLSLKSIFNKEVIKILNKALPVLIIYSVIIFLQNLDMIFFRILFDSTSSGKLASIVALSKIPFFIFSFLIYILFPEIKKNPENFIKLLKSNKIIIYSISITLLSIFLSLLVYMFGDTLVTTLFGVKFGSLKTSFVLLSNYYFQLTILLALGSSFIAIKRYNIFLLSIFIIIIFLSLIIYLDLNIQSFIKFILLMIVTINFILIAYSRINLK